MLTSDRWLNYLASEVPQKAIAHLQTKQINIELNAQSTNKDQPSSRSSSSLAKIHKQQMKQI